MAKKEKKAPVENQELPEEKEVKTSSVAAEDGAEDETTKTDDAVEKELTELKESLSEMEDKYLRAQAEIANMTRRNRSEREQLARYRSQDLAKGILGSLDNLERALSAEVSNEQAESLKKGVTMVLESLRHALKEEGVTEIPAFGVAFDPNLHQAVQTVPASEETPSDTVVEVLQKGYQLHDRVLRPAMVIVAQ